MIFKSGVLGYLYWRKLEFLTTNDRKIQRCKRRQHLIFDRMGFGLHSCVLDCLFNPTEGLCETGKIDDRQSTSPIIASSSLRTKNPAGQSDQPLADGNAHGGGDIRHLKLFVNVCGVESHRAVAKTQLVRYLLL